MEIFKNNGEVFELSNDDASDSDLSPRVLDAAEFHDASGEESFSSINKPHPPRKVRRRSVGRMRNWSTNPYEITDIRPAVKNEHRVNIFLGGKFAFSLDLTQVVDFKLKAGQIITEDDLLRYRKASNFGKLYQRTLEWVLTRPHSIRETVDYLHRKQRQNPEYEISDEDISVVLEKLQEKGYLDDAKFAEYYLENRFQRKGISEKRLRLELAKKGVSSTEIDQAFAVNSRSDAVEIQKIIAKKRYRYSTDKKLISYLVRQGFDFELARSAVREMDSQNLE